MHKDHMSLHFTLILQWTVLEIHRADLGMFVQVGRLSCYHISINPEGMDYSSFFFLFYSGTYLYLYQTIGPFTVCTYIHSAYIQHTQLFSAQKVGRGVFLLNGIGQGNPNMRVFFRRQGYNIIWLYIYIFCLIYEKVFHQVLFLNCSVCP